MKCFQVGMIVGLMLELETRHCAEDFIETSISANQKPVFLKIDQSQDRKLTSCSSLVCIVCTSFATNTFRIHKKIILDTIQYTKIDTRLKYVYGQEILMHKRPILIIPLLKAGAHCWEAQVNSAKLRNPSPNFKTPEPGSGACD